MIYRCVEVERGIASFMSSVDEYVYEEGLSQHPEGGHLTFCAMAKRYGNDTIRPDKCFKIYYTGRDDLSGSSLVESM